MFFRIIPSKEQLLLLLEEKRKAQETNKRVCWADAAKILNAKGPSIKSAIRWRRVITKLYMTNIKINLKLFLLVLLLGTKAYKKENT